MALISIFAAFAIPDYRPGVIGVAIFYALGLIYFAVYARHHLVAEAPEEEFALIELAEEELA